MDQPHFPTDSRQMFIAKETAVNIIRKKVTDCANSGDAQRSYTQPQV